MTTLAAPTAAELAKQALNQLNSLATLPEVTANVIKTVEDPKSSAAQLHAIVRHDPALVSRVLKVVNSAFYGLPGQVTSIDRAIVLLGLNAVKNLSVAASMGQMFRGMHLSSKYSAKDLWAHCVAVAVIAKEIAKKVKPALADEAFLCGMVHDIGILIELQTWPEKVWQTCEQLPDAGTYMEIEKKVIGVNHTFLGKLLAEKWQFPKLCQTVASLHHTPHLAGETERELVNIIYIADTLCCQTGYAFCLTGATQQITADHLKAINAAPGLVDEMKAKIPEFVRSAAPLLAL
ncbi:MAG: HDOD domain-containing protein [Tepidisphaeraceae bacterium]